MYKGKATSEKPVLLKIGNYGESVSMDNYVELTKDSIATSDEINDFLKKDPEELLAIVTKEGLSQ